MTIRLEGDASNEEIWIFGFGSLIWKAGFEYQKRVEGYIKEYRRVFYQGSTDHRGTPEAPGRVVTLEHTPGGQCWGAAYLISGTFDEQQETLATAEAASSMRFKTARGQHSEWREKQYDVQYLEWREKQYDLRVRVDVFGHESAEEPIVRGALTYIASDNRLKNLNYAGPAPREAIALQIASAFGPSGPNAEYLHSLVAALKQMGVHEEELLWLDERVRLLKVKLYTVPEALPMEVDSTSVQLVVTEDCLSNSIDDQSGCEVRAQQN